ncbi:hypothetical protein [Spongiactinospora sp. TRM90649]|uniref:hypothetical protein n=1 Tax=Spongiactinospora sp. TRM90649 TaxID=3031114 RepID=UPI0023FA3BD4|nr:hypothetical protein [Spongiactinospora sp. TRM90649]MDF5752182.1 hypothetical protein [Spongiactinospora sp. TRM90649]
MTAGAVVGLGVFAIGRTSGFLLFAITGALAGALVAGGLDAYRRSARLAEVKVTLPQLSELTFVVNNDSRQVAWQLFIESVTRVSAQRLDDEDGLLREALTSLYGLFATTRETLKVSRPSTHVNIGMTVECLAVNFLNLELRPFLSRWHPRLRAFEQESPGRPETDWPLATECRAELRLLQRNAHEYLLAFARLAGIRDAEAMLNPPSATAPPLSVR